MLDYILSGAEVFTGESFERANVAVSGGSIKDIFSDHFTGAKSLQLNDCFIFPGFIDVHVHLREPGFFYKETIETGSMSAAAGGFTHVCAMPNLSPVPDCLESLRPQLEAIEKTAKVNVYPYGTITKGEKGGELAELREMSEYVAAFSDDGRGVQSREMMKNAMKVCRECGKILAAHCEDEALVNGGYIHLGEYAKAHGHKGISSESEWTQVERDVLLAEETGCAYHVCHVSTKESVDIIRKAKKRGVDVTCETAPHYLVFDDSMLHDDGRFKMNPPIRSSEDKRALIEGICDGTVDMIATDHAPHSSEEKSGGLRGSIMGIVGLETAFAVMYTHFVKTGIISIKRLLELMHTNAHKRFGIGNPLSVGEAANLTVFDLRTPYKIDSGSFLSKGKSTPFDGMEVFGRCVLTMANGGIVYKCTK